MAQPEHCMQQALRLAEQGLGRVWPNPAVGALVVKDGAVLGCARTGDGGRPHAETQALQQAGAQARGATLYVTLEPCAHQGQTPPCTDAIIRAGIATAVVACRDPHEKVGGRGIQRLRDAGIEVIESVCEAEAKALNCGFFSVVERRRPWVTMKVATSADGYIATGDGATGWITGEQARRHSHRLRSRNDAILTGIGTVLADDPQLTCRLPGLEHASPVRVVVDRQDRMPPRAKMLTDGGPPVWRYGREKRLPEILEDLAQRGITRLMVEAGSRLNAALLCLGLVDELHWYRAPVIIGSGGLAAFGDNWDGPLDGRPRMRVVEERVLGEDRLTIYRLADSR